jgi:hypothetical protein
MPWELTGNANTNETINFLGTTDNHSLVIRTNNTEALLVNAGGKVGIGTGSPGERLTVGGASLADTKIEVNSGGDQYAALRIKNTQGSWVWQVVPSADSPGGRLRLADETAGREWFAITHTGNVGIGTASPGERLTVGGASLADTKIEVNSGGDQYAALRIKNTQGSWVWQVVPSADSPSGRLRLADETAGREWFAVTHTGNVGIGTVSPTTKLDVAGDIAATGNVNALGNIGGANITGAHVTCLNGLSTIGAVSHTGDMQVNGNVTTSGNITTNGDIFLPGADCAEQFDVTEASQIEPGTVVVIDRDGTLRQSFHAYDKKVAGVVSGAGAYRPGIVLDKQAGAGNRLPIALVGKVYCKVDAAHSPIEVGDLLTTSPTPGHAMKASDPLLAFGAVIGKALRPWSSGYGLIPILIALQ